MLGIEDGELMGVIRGVGNRGSIKIMGQNVWNLKEVVEIGEPGAGVAGRGKVLISVATRAPDTSRIIIKLKNFGEAKILTRECSSALE